MNPNTPPDTGKINAALSRLEKVILDSINFEQVVQKIVDSVFYELDYLQMGYRIVVLALVNKEKQALERVSISRTSKAETAIAALPYPFDYVDIPLSAKENYCIRAMDERKPFITHFWPDILTPPISKEQALEVQAKAGIKASMVYPLIAHDKAIGIMIFSLIKDESEVSPEEKELLIRFTDVVGLAVQNSQLYSTLKETSDKLQEANQRLEQLDKLKDEFVSLASHELRTPMTAIKSYIWLVLQQGSETLTDKQKEYLQNTYTSTERLIKLVNDMLNVSRIEGGRLIITPKPTHIEQLVQDIITEVEPTAKERGLTVSVTPSQTQLPEVMADPDKIKEVMMNLVGNSLKFTPSGGTITISFSENNGMIETHVADTGTGIKQEDMPKLFQKFGMIEGNYLQTTKGQGTGLGLYITKNIVQLHGGTITVHSDGENKGTMFTFSLKRADQASQAAAGVGGTS